MRVVIVLLVSAFLFCGPAAAQTPAGADAAAARLMTRIGPQTRNWIRSEAAREHAAGTVSAAAARQAIARNPGFGGLGGTDVEALAFLVLMEATKSAQQDLKEIMNRVKRINAAKAALRRASARRAKPAMAENCKSCPPRAATVPQGRAALARPPRSPARIAVQPRPLSRPEFDRRLQAARNDSGSLRTMGEMESMRLQMAMDRRLKLMSALSNLMKKVSDTKAGITQNLK